MITVEKTHFGFKMVLQGRVEPGDIEQAGVEIQKAIADHKDGFSAFVDFRHAGLLSPEVQVLTKQLMEIAKSSGLKRSATILNSALAGLQSKRLATEAGVFSVERYIDASKHPNWEQLALDWVERGIEPTS